MAAVVAAAMGLNVHHWKTNLSYNVFKKFGLCAAEKPKGKTYSKQGKKLSFSVGRQSKLVHPSCEGRWPELHCLYLVQLEVVGCSGAHVILAVTIIFQSHQPVSFSQVEGSFVSGSGCSVHLEFQLSTLLCRRGSFSFRLIFEKFTCRPHWDVVQDQVVQVLQNLFHRWVMSRVSQSNELLRDHAGEGRVVQQRSDSFGWYHTAGCKALTQLATQLVDLHVLGHPASCPLKFHQCENAQADLLDTFFERTDTNEPHSFYQDMHSWPKSFILQHFLVVSCKADCPEPSIMHTLSKV